MAAPYSLDLREKLIRAYEQGRGSQRALAQVFGVSRGFVEQLWDRYRSTGEFAPKPHGGGPRARIDGHAEGRLRQWVEEQPDATLEELCTRLQAATRIKVSPSRLCRVLQRLDLPRKKSRSMLRSATPSGSDKHGRTIRRG
jgi:transposase